jgi:hypothetical protein
MDYEDYMDFWSMNYNDECADKVMLMKKMSQLLCFKCSPPKVKHKIFLYSQFDNFSFLKGIVS